MVAGAWPPAAQLHGTEASLFQHRTIAALAAVILLVALRATTAVAASVTLVWTAPGDDSLTGRAFKYDMRYSTSPLTLANFNLATPIANLPFPSSPGVTQSFTEDGLQSGVLLYFALRTQDAAGNWSGLSNVLSVVPAEIAADLSQPSLSFSLPMPNPARESARFACAMPETGSVKVQVFDLAGRLVRTLADGPMGPGSRDLIWDLRDQQGARLAGGVYLVRAQLGAVRFIRRVVIVR